ncbi:hypothetical protein WN943_009784 [Citrus x changshan-huyou]
MNISSIKMILIVTLVVTASWQLMEVEVREVALNIQGAFGIEVGQRHNRRNVLSDIASLCERLGLLLLALHS